MADLYSSFISKSFLRSIWELEFEAFRDSEDERALCERLRRWSARKDLRETSAEAAFIEEFFRDTWGYEQTGQAGAESRAFSRHLLHHREYGRQKARERPPKTCRAGQPSPRSADHSAGERIVEVGEGYCEYCVSLTEAGG
jgi:hypothetical protein